MNGNTREHGASRIASIVVTVMLACTMAMAFAGCSQPAGDSSSASADSSAAASSANEQSTEAASAEDAEVAYTLKIDASAVDEGYLFDGSETAAAGTTVYEALIATGLDLEVKSSSGSVYVDGIDGVVGSKVSSTSGWMYAVNGEWPDVGADQCVIKDGDLIEWTFIKGE